MKRSSKFIVIHMMMMMMMTMMMIMMMMMMTMMMMMMMLMMFGWERVGWAIRRFARMFVRTSDGTQPCLLDHHLQPFFYPKQMYYIQTNKQTRDLKF